MKRSHASGNRFFAPNSWNDNADRKLDSSAMVDEKSIMLNAVIIVSSGFSFMVNPIRYWSFT